MDGQSDNHVNVKTVYPPINTVCGGYKKILISNQRYINYGYQKNRLGSNKYQKLYVKNTNKKGKIVLKLSFYSSKARSMLHSCVKVTSIKV